MEKSQSAPVEEEKKDPFAGLTAKQKLALKKKMKADEEAEKLKQHAATVAKDNYAQAAQRKQE